MTASYLISASILSSDFTRLGEQIQEAENAGADWIHIDVMDGHFVPNLTMGPVIVEACRKVTQLPLDVHLMVESPENLLPAFAQAGSTILSVHVETCPHLHRTIQIIHELGCKAGVVLNPATPVNLVQPVLHMVDLVLVMSVNPGYAGQSFLPEVLPKIPLLRHDMEKINHHAWLEIDGGINPNTISQAIEAGAHVFVAASAIFNYSDGIAKGIQLLRSHFPR
jgi:ribulose-phosphate 3-epimerase